ncbi:kelch-like protein 24 isoform X3 [Oculina patagonica]
MACNIPTSEETNVKESYSTSEETTPDEEEKKVSHRFSEPWEDSDVILVVEDEKFHVHRLILSMNSPVFKAMFKSEFKEATNNEIPLPEKKASEVLDFLKQLYVQERQEITLNNVEHLLKLSDEYQVKVIFDPCVKFLDNQPKTEENAMKILVLASLYKLENVRQSCYYVFKNMKLQSILKASQDQDLDKENMQNILSQRIERLENFLDKVYPQFMGLVECCFWLWHESKKYMEWCPKHFHGGRSYHGTDKLIRECTVCGEMLYRMINSQGTFDYHSLNQ